MPHTRCSSLRSIPIFPPFPFASGIILLGLCWGWGRVLGEVMILGYENGMILACFVKTDILLEKSWNICFKWREYFF